jgi:hypothetical protein
MQEDAAFRATKDDLLQQIAKVDREIAKAESEIAKLKKKQHELEEAANKPSIKKEEEEITQPKHQSPAQKIYAENRVWKFCIIVTVVRPDRVGMCVGRIFMKWLTTN